MITVIVSTNRKESKSEVVGSKYLEMLLAKGAEAQLFSLKDLPSEFLISDMYGKRSPEMTEIIRQFVEKTDKFVFIIPEYNGSYPGILKLFIDGLHPRFFKEKKAGIIGVSDGHAGNLRGQSHLTGVLHYLKMHVHFAQPKLSDIDHAITEANEISDERTLRLLSEHADYMIAY